MHRALSILRFGPLAAAASLALANAAGAQTFYGPLPYLSRSDSPFTDWVYFENFEDHQLDVPGVTASDGFVTSSQFSSLFDSVDADDGNIDGSGSAGDSWFTGLGDVTFSFDPLVLGGLPTRAGLVWTDGSGTTNFEAFDANGVSLGVIGPFQFADGSFNGGTAEDRFFGVEHAPGISAIRIFAIGAMEIDHLQFALTTGVSVKATETKRLGSPANPDVLRPSRATPPILGTLWAPYVDHSSFEVNATLDLLAIDLRPGINVPLSFGTLLCLVPPTSQLFAVPAGAPFAVEAPELALFAGVPLCSQAASFTPGSGVRLTNALDLVLGTY